MALEALGERKTKTLKHLHQLKLALKGCKPGPNCMERMIAFEVLRIFLPIKHLSLKGYFQISAHAEIMLAVINYLLITPPPCNLSFQNPHCLSEGGGMLWKQPPPKTHLFTSQA